LGICPACRTGREMLPVKMHSLLAAPVSLSLYDGRV
jgi:hypothetical protein